MIKRPKISKHEIIADAVFIAVGIIAALIAVFIFDIHWSFYPGNTIFPPNKYIFTDKMPYVLGALVGGLLGPIIIKLLFFAFMQEEEAIREGRRTVRKKS